MRTLAEIIEDIKNLKKLGTDGDVANLLDIKPKTLASSKARNSIPFFELTAFCSKEGISLNWLLTRTGPAFLAEAISLQEDPKLANLIEKLRFVLEKGSIRDKAVIRGLIEEVYDMVQEDLEKAAALEKAKKGA